MDKSKINPEKPPWHRVIISVLSAAIGIQSDKNRIRDFEYGSPARYIIVGLIFTVIFIIVILFIVNLVLKTTPG